MKKVIFLFAMVLSYSMAIAQGTGNKAEVVQFGSNIGIITQTGDDNIGAIAQGTLIKPVTNVITTYYKSGAWINQIGKTNTASAIVTGGSVGNTINQTGDLNKGTQVLGASSSYIVKTDPRTAIAIDQVGDGNEAHQITRSNFGSYGIQNMYIDQIGMNNFARQYSNGGQASVMTVRQEGTGNGNAFTSDVVTTTQSSPLALAWGTLMHPANAGGIDAAAITAGDFTQYQNGRFSTATIDVLGDNNKTTQLQEFTEWGPSGNNSATLGVVGNTNTSVQAQMGEFNTSTVDVDGSANVIGLSQLGNNNGVDVDLVGGSTDCIVGVSQIGEGHAAVVYQSGVTNFALVLQQ